MPGYIPTKLAASRVSPLVRKPTMTPRRCLTYGKPFASTGPGNRRCVRCTNNPPADKLG